MRLGGACCHPGPEHQSPGPGFRGAPGSKSDSAASTELQPASSEHSSEATGLSSEAWGQRGPEGMHLESQPSKAEAGESLVPGVQGQPGRKRETLCCVSFKRRRWARDVPQLVECLPRCTRPWVRTTAPHTQKKDEEVWGLSTDGAISVTNIPPDDVQSKVG